MKKAFRFLSGTRSAPILPVTQQSVTQNPIDVYFVSLQTSSDQASPVSTDSTAPVTPISPGCSDETAASPGCSALPKKKVQFSMIENVLPYEINGSPTCVSRPRPDYVNNLIPLDRLATIEKRLVTSRNPEARLKLECEKVVISPILEKRLVYFEKKRPVNDMKLSDEFVDYFLPSDDESESSHSPTI